MTIGGYQAFINFIGSDNIPSLRGLKDCIEQVNKICSCQKQRKATKSEECNSMYIDLVKSIMPNMVEYLRTKTTDSEIIFHHNGSHEILRIKLR